MKLPKVYEPSIYEEDIYALWEKSEAFLPRKRGSNDTFSMVFPLPNANGDLHLGHALTNAIYDIVIRYHRMKGEATLYLPGADHAGFETQVVYEKELAKQGKSRFDFTRDELYQQIWDFVELNKSNFERQFRLLGASCDWTRYTYTLDDKIIKLAYQTFKKMWDEGLIYRGERLVNFCTFHGTGFADVEVEYKQTSGHLWHIRYPLTDGSGELIVATTRPETMLGDTAVSVHPQDARYTAFIGKTVKLPLTKREVPIIADDFVDKEFGTGAVKITPAHDPNDFEAAERHDLPMISVISHEGKMTHEVPEPYRNLNVDEARQAVVADLQDLGLLVKVENHSHSVGHCYKCGTVIQPLLREQWFVDMKSLATAAIKALRADKIQFYPAGKKDQLITYLKGLKDWNISRQIAWGIPIPAFQNIEDSGDWIFDERVNQEIIELKGKKYRRDSDVFDTWFSSSSWPYATLDFPGGEDFKHFYPTSLLDTGGEILYPWVSRMIMLGLYMTKEVPFEGVYIHGYVMAEDGSKMSKSVGNVIAPVPVIEQYGSDALRMGLIAGRSPGVNRGYDGRRVEEARNFGNKLWNVARFVEDKLGEDFHYKVKPRPTSPADHWILNKINYLITTMTRHLDEYRFAEAYELLYHFVWDDLADWYIESSKVELNPEVLAYVLDTTLRAAHPFAPFLTETIWQTLNWQGDSLLITSQWPEAIKASREGADTFEQIRTLVNEIRYIRSETRLSGLTLYHTGEKFLNENAGLIKALAGLKNIGEVRDGHGLHLTQTNYRCWLDIDQQAAARFVKQLEAKREGYSKTIEQLESRLSNESYVKNAPKKVVEETKAQLVETKLKLAKVTEEKKRFSSTQG